MFPVSLATLNEQQRHDYILKTFVLNKQNYATTKRERRDIDVIRDNHRFLWDDANPPSDCWETRLAKRYYDKLFKEYCIADLSRYKENKIALRWRTEAEVITGKGQFQCGSRKCEEREGLRSWEVNFAYVEHGLRNNALVKVRLCPEHSAQLNYQSQKREIKRLKRADRLEKKSKTHKQHKDKAEKQNSKEKPDSIKIDASIEELVTKSDEKFENHSKKLTTNEDQTLPEEDVWSKKPEVELEPNSRETDFERYLEDLLL